MLYLLDANILIDANRYYYPIDRVPEFWEWILRLGNSEQVKIPQETFEEIAEGNDSVADWVNEHFSLIRLQEEVSPQHLSRVIELGYADDLTDEEIEKIGRDPFLIAYALRTCLRSLGYVKLRLFARQGNHVSFLSQRHHPGAIRPDSSHAGIGPPTDQAPHRGPVRRLLRGALLTEKRLPVANAPGGLPGLAHLLQVFPAME